MRGELTNGRSDQPCGWPRTSAGSGVEVHRQEVDHVGPALPFLVLVAHQLHRDRVAVGVVADQDAAEVVASFRVRECGVGSANRHISSNTALSVQEIVR